MIYGLKFKLLCYNLKAERLSCFQILRCCIIMLIAGILTFMSRINFMFSWVEHEKCFITSGPGQLSWVPNYSFGPLRCETRSSSKLTVWVI